MLLFGQSAVWYNVDRFTKQPETNACKRLYLAQNDIEIRWIASSGMLTIHNRFCYFKIIGKFINPTEPVE